MPLAHGASLARRFGWVLLVLALAMLAHAEGYDAQKLAQSWQYVDEQHSDGWKNETFTVARFNMPSMVKTDMRLDAIKQWMKDPKVVAARAMAKDDPKIAATFDTADKALDEVASKVDKAFNDWCEYAETHKRPQGSSRAAIGNASEMARQAGLWLTDTKYLDADVARATKIDQTWKDQISGANDQHSATLKKMTADAKAAWPAIEKAINPQKDFKPTDAAAAKGKTFVFKKVRNRAGSDFDGRHDVEFWVDGQPVAGDFEPNVKKAFQAARKAIGADINDHINWTVIAVIEGPGTVNRRTTSEVRGSDQQVIGKVESTRPMDCTIIRVIALHAGPVAVGPE